jgi:hypothetical protein
MQFTDRLTIDKAHRTKDGYLRVTAKAARTGIQDYLGREVDPEGKHFAADQVVRVYRPPEEVFAADAVASFIGKPVTDDHPHVPVTSANWRDHSRGVIGGAVRDGEWLRFDLALMDAGTVEKVDAGKRELSNGYACDVAFESGVTPKGEAYDAVQRNIRGNHVAVVRAARAGPECRISDGGNELFQKCDAATVILSSLEDQETKKMPHTLIIDGLQVPNVSDEAKAAIEKLQGQVSSLTTAKDAADANVTTLTADKAKLEAEKVTLEKQVADAKLTPQQLRDAAKAYAATVEKAKALGVAVTDAMDEPAIMKAVVDAQMGELAKDWTPEQIAASFALATKDAKTADGGSQVINTPIVVGDAEKLFADAQDKARKERANAWKTPATSAAAA